MLSKPIAFIAACIALALGTTAKGQQVGQLDPDTTSPASISLRGLPKSPHTRSDNIAWSNFLICVTRQNAQGMTAPRFYEFFIPGGNDAQSIDARDRQRSNLEDDLTRGIRPGNLIAFGGPDAEATTATVSRAFKDTATTYPMTNVTVVVIGRKSDETQLAHLISQRGATLRFVDAATATCPAAAASVPTPMGSAIFPPSPPPEPPPPPSIPHRV
jgi:hypothetical protein